MSTARRFELQLCQFQDVSNMSNVPPCPLRVGLTILDSVEHTAPKSPTDTTQEKELSY